MIRILLCSVLLGCGSATPAPRPAPEAPAAPAPAPAPAPPPVAPATDDSTMVPGKNLGPVTAATTRADLARRYGEGALIDMDLDVGEGMTEPATRVGEDTPTAFSVVWTDKARTKPSEVRELGPAWRTPEGIGMGTTHAELEKILGPFEMAGFGWDYSGTIFLEKTRLASYDGLLILRERPRARVEGAHWEAVQGDRSFSSSSADLRALDLAVNEIILRFALVGG